MSNLLESTKYFALLALAGGPSHGAEIRQQIIGDTMEMEARMHREAAGLAQERLGWR
jgi:DNA-binding PadR family transcriptional regulator